jgi:hypothetical protein
VVVDLISECPIGKFRPNPVLAATNIIDDLTTSIDPKQKFTFPVKNCVEYVI